MSTINQRNATRNQSTADFTRVTIFIFDNRFERGIYTQAASSPPNSGNLQTGMLVARDTTNPGQYIPVTASNLADVIGVAEVSGGPVALGANATLQIAVCNEGGIDGLQLVLPATVTLDTAVGNKNLSDVLNSLGFHVERNSVENTNFDN